MGSTRVSARLKVSKKLSIGISTDLNSIFGFLSPEKKKKKKVQKIEKDKK